MTEHRFPNLTHDAMTVQRALITSYMDEPRRKGSKLRREASEALQYLVDFASDAEEERLRLVEGLRLIANAKSPPPFKATDWPTYAREVLRGADVR